MKRRLIYFLSFILLTGALFGVGFRHHLKKRHEPPQFDNMMVIHPETYVKLIDHDNPELEKISKRVKTPVNAYYFVRDFIAFDPSAATAPPGITLSARAANCLGKAILLYSMYRDLEVPKKDVRIVMGEVTSRGEHLDHAWVELRYNGQWIQQDPTDLLGIFDFNQFPGRAYTNKFNADEQSCFNDTGFALVSQMNRFRD